MDESIPRIIFDESGVCNYCRDYLSRMEGFELKSNRESKLNEIIKLIRQSSSKPKYDCIVGVSGGVDSTFVLYKAVMLGLRPLAVHMDNCWNSKIAESNIFNLVSKLGVDLYTHVVDWNTYRGLMQSFLNADVVDIELIYDNAQQAVNFQAARKFGVNYILTGNNIYTEGLKMPPGWNWYKRDLGNIRSINGGELPNQLDYPHINSLEYYFYRVFCGIRKIPLISHVDFRYPEVISQLIKSVGFQPYPYKHYENVFTRFYQGWILPQKFLIDKRKPHLSALVVRGEMNRDYALSLLSSIAYPSIRDLDEDKEYFLKKMR
jgi:N-acetyl sugar amidotransferase